ncbi:Uncharacterised protein [Mycobacteroides abscessus subsp. abscessus]|nr:Uncharacterised protein [Mycobacteroides abscessus subsp. abscessus]
MTCSTAYPRLARSCTVGSKPQLSRCHGPPWTTSTSGSPSGSVPTGNVRYEFRVSPSRAVIVTGTTGARSAGSRCGYGRKSWWLSPVAWS